MKVEYNNISNACSSSTSENTFSSSGEDKYEKLNSAAEFEQTFGTRKVEDKQ